MDVRKIVMPGYPDYDGGLPGVSGSWGRKRWFVPAKDPEQFWNTFPFGILRDHFVPEKSPELPPQSPAPTPEPSAHTSTPA